MDITQLVVLSVRYQQAEKLLKNSIFLIIFITFQVHSYGQNLDGLYIWSGEIKGPKTDYGIVEIKIDSDSTYTQTDFSGYKADFDDRENKWNRIVRSGKIKKDGGFYLLTEIGNRKNWHLVKIRRNKLVIYGYKKKRNGKLKKVKGIELKKASW